MCIRDSIYYIQNIEFSEQLNLRGLGVAKFSSSQLEVLPESRYSALSRSSMMHVQWAGRARVAITYLSVGVSE